LMNITAWLAFNGLITGLGVWLQLLASCNLIVQARL